VKIDDKDTELLLLETIGRGSFGTVWKAECVGEDRFVAVKVVEDSSGGAVKEAKMMQNLDRKFVVSVLGFGSVNKITIIAMEYFEMGSLQSVVEKQSLPLHVSVALLYHIAEGMNYLHSKKIIHRDLKPGNVLVSSLDPASPTMCKITDFGEARDIETANQTMTMTAGIGTPYYMAPEMMTSSKHYSTAVDVYSFGVMSAHVLHGKLEYEENPEIDLEFDSIYAFAMLVCKGLRPMIGSCSDDLKKIIESCWDSDPKKRPTFETIVPGIRRAMISEMTQAIAKKENCSENEEKQ